MDCLNFERINFVANAEQVFPYYLLFTDKFSHANQYFSSGCTADDDCPFEFWTLVQHILLYVALLSLDCITAHLPSVALLYLRLQHTHLTLVSYSNHLPYWTWRWIRQRFHRNGVPHSLRSYHITLLFILRLLVCSCHSVVDFFGDSTTWILLDLWVISSNPYKVFPSLHLSLFVTFFRRLSCFITFFFHPPNIHW